jgi:hypothetical protein
VNSEERPPGRIAWIIDRLRDIANWIDITEIACRRGDSAQGKGTQLLVTTRIGSLSLSTSSTGEEEPEDGPGRTRAIGPKK